MTNKAYLATRCVVPASRVALVFMCIVAMHLRLCSTTLTSVTELSEHFSQLAIQHRCATKTDLR